jgi:hypothetical protein
MLHMFHTYVLNVLAVSFLCCSRCFYVASFLSKCCICFTQMLHVYVPNDSFALDLCYIQVFHVVRRGPGIGGRGTVS